MKKINKIRLFSLGIISVMLVADQVIKYFVDIYLKPVSVKMLVPGFIQLLFFENDGAMMGMMSG